MNLMNNLEIDLEEETEETKTKRSCVIDLLKERNLLKYGAILKETDVEFVMSVKRSDLDETLWQFTILQVREIVKSEGFYVTSRGRDGDLYILMPHEMPQHNEKKNKATFRNIKQRSRALHMIDQSLLSDEHQKKLEFEIFRNARVELQLHESLKKRCRY